MIAHIFRLSVWEWHKLRRRWLPWVLLAIVVTLMQAAVWGAYVVHRSEPFSPAHGIQLSDTEGENKETVFEAEWKCKDVRGDRIPPGNRGSSLTKHREGATRQCRGVPEIMRRL